jgi:DNA-binding IclR family transcriptional regulator
MDNPVKRVLRSLNLSLDVLELLAAEPDKLSLSAIALRLGLSKAAVHGILSNLVTRGYVQRSGDNNRYRLGHRMWELGIAAGERIELRKLADDDLQSLTRLTGESSQLSEYCTSGEVLYLHKVNSPNPVQAYVEVGGRAPAYCVATGRVLLAHQSQSEIEAVCEKPLTAFTPNTVTDPKHLREELALIRERGYAINRGEYRGEIVGVAAPVRNHLGAVVASVSISGPSYRFGITRAKSFAPAIVAAALSISRKLGWAPQKAPVGGERARAS